MLPFIHSFVYRKHHSTFSIHNNIPRYENVLLFSIYFANYMIKSIHNNLTIRTSRNLNLNIFFCTAQSTYTGYGIPLRWLSDLLQFFFSYSLLPLLYLLPPFRRMNAKENTFTKLYQVRN